MDLEVSNISLNASQISNSVWKSMPPELIDKFNFIFYLGKIILLLMILYLVMVILVKIFGFFFSARETKILKDIREQGRESNKKLSEIANLLQGHKYKKKSA